jgi:hypothetical protein
MMAGKDRLLSEKEEMLVMLLRDGEGSFFERLKAKRLMSSSLHAQEFYSELERQSTSIQATLQVGSFEHAVPVDEVAIERLWKQVSRGIDAEDRAKVWMPDPAGRGQRGFDGKAPLGEGIFGWSTRPSFRYGVGGSVAFASLLIAVFGVVSQKDSQSVISASSQSEQGGNPLVAGAFGGGQSSSVQSVAFSNQSSGNAPGYAGFAKDLVAASSSSDRMRADKFDPVEVDWLRSDGRIRMLSDGRNGAAVVWVSRNPGSVNGMNQGAFASDKDDARLVGGSQAIEILPEHIPGSIAVSNSR